MSGPTLAEADLGNGLKIRLVRGDSLSPAEQAAALSVIEAAFGPWPSFELPVPAIDHLRWKLAGPYPGDAGYVRLTEKSGRLAGFAHAPRQDIIVSGRRLRGVGGGDTSTHPDFQGQGLYNARARFDENLTHLYDISLNFSSNPTILNATERDPHSHWLGNWIAVRIRPLDARRLAAGPAGRVSPWMRRAAYGAAAIAGAGGDALFRGREPTLQLREISGFDERFDGFFEEASKPFDFIVDRTARYLNWRYCDPRGGTFTPVLAEWKGRMLGYSVLKTQGGVVCIADLLALQERRDVAAALIQHAISVARRRRAMALTCWMPRHHPYTALLRRHGFFDTRRKTCAAFAVGKALGWQDVAFLEEPTARAHITHGDSDWI
jgi:hypothetical protein